jgi:HD-like signal output (HDOD) protein
MTQHILFVDDMPEVLQGIRRMLHSRARQWQLHFATSGAIALETLERTPIDVIVADMRMPGMDGVQLLREVQRLYPNTARVAISGHLGERMIMNSAAVAHQFLAKPCAAEKLISVITRILALRRLLHDEELQCLATEMDNIPSLPELYQAIQDELASPLMSMKRIGDIIASDLGMSAKVLQLVNSSFFGLFTRVSSPSQAVNLLGAETVKALVLHVHIFSQHNPRACQHFSLARLARHSFEVSMLARSLALLEDAPQDVVDNAFLAGVMHDVGQLLFAVNHPHLYDELLAMVQADAMELHRTEEEVFGGGHDQLGAYLMGLWGMPEPVVEAIAFHHRPAEVPSDTFSPLAALHAAECLDSASQRSGLFGKPMELDMDYIAECGLTERVEAWQARATELLGGGNA